MFDLDKFKNGEFFVHLPTREDFDKTMKYLEENNIKWINGDSLTNRSFLDDWSRYGYYTCLRYEKNEFSEGLVHDALENLKEDDYVGLGMEDQNPETKEEEITIYEEEDVNEIEYIDMNEKIKRDLIVLLFEKEFGFEIDYGHVLKYKGRIIFKSLDDTARFIDFIEELRAEYMITGREVAKTVVDKLNINDYEFENE